MSKNLRVVVLSEAKNLNLHAEVPETVRVHEYWVYIMSSRNRVLYVGVTKNLQRRVAEHKEMKAGFTSRYNVTGLVYCERST